MKWRWPNGSSRRDAQEIETGGHELRRGLSDVMGADMDDQQIHALADIISAMFNRAALACDTGADSTIYEDAIDSVLTALHRQQKHQLRDD